MNVMSSLLAFILPLIYILFLTGTFIYVFKKKFNFQFLLPVALISATIFVYFFTFIFHSITAGLIITIVAAAAFIPLIILDKGRKDTLKSLFFTPPFFIFVLLYLILFVFHCESVLQLFSDDNMHWAPHVWTMWLRDDFYTSPGLSIVTHGDYPPILQLFQLIFSKLAGMYREGLLYVALEITCFSMIFPVFKNLAWKKGKTLKTVTLSLLILISFMALPTTLDVTHLFYNALHPDYAIAFVFVFGVYLAVTESRKFAWSSAIILSSVVTFLSLTKQSSVLFGGLVGLIYIAGLYHSYRPKAKTLPSLLLKYMIGWRKNWLSILLALVLLLLPLVALKLWQVQTRGFQAPYCCVAIFHVSPSDSLKVPDVLLRKSGNTSQQNYARDFFRYILTYQAGFTTQILSSVSYTQFVLLFVAAMIYVGYNYKDKFRRSKLIATASIIVFGWFAYCLAIYLTFLFGGMSDSERDNLLTGDRYLRTYIFAMLLILFLITVNLIINKFNQSKTTNKTLVVFSISLIAVTGLVFNVDNLKNGYLVESFKYNADYSAVGMENVDQFSERMRAFTKTIGGTYASPKKIAVTERTNGNATYFLRYLAIPNKVDNGSDVVFDSNTTSDEVCNLLRNNDFLFINHVYNEKEAVLLINGCITNKVESLKQYEAFKIERDGDSLRLTDWHF